MGVDIHNVGIHGWADNAYRTPSCSPLYVNHALPALIPAPSHLPNRSRTQEVDIQCLHPRESMAVAAPREENSFRPQVPQWEEEAKRAFLDRSDHQSKSLDLPCPSRSLHLQSWLLCGRTAEGVTHLSPSEGAPILSPTNLHRSVKRGRPHKDHPL
jgi:hypothetical protein